VVNEDNAMSLIKAAARKGHLNVIEWVLEKCPNIAIHEDPLFAWAAINGSV